MVQLQAVVPQLTEMGFRVLGISPDPPAKALETANAHPLDIPLLSDSQMTACSAFGLAFQRPGRSPLPVPAVYVTGADGAVRFQYVNPNYRVRLDPDVLIAAARAALGGSGKKR